MRTRNEKHVELVAGMTSVDQRVHLTIGWNKLHRASSDCELFFRATAYQSHGSRGVTRVDATMSHLSHVDRDRGTVATIGLPCPKPCVVLKKGIACFVHKAPLDVHSGILASLLR